MREQFCSYEIALKLKELGFDEECCAIYRHEKLFPILGFEKINSIKQSVIAAPLWQQAQSFLREKHNLHIVIDKVCNLNNAYTFWNYELCYVNNEDIIMEPVRGIKTYEQALEAGLFEALKLVKV